MFSQIVLSFSSIILLRFINNIIKLPYEHFDIGSVSQLMSYPSQDHFKYLLVQSMVENLCRFASEGRSYISQSQLLRL